MTQSGDNVTITAILNLNIEQAKKQFKELSDSLTGSIANIMGQGGTGRKVGDAEGRVVGSRSNRTAKQQEERDKVRNTALQNMAKSFPGGGLMTTMAKSFGQGGVIGGVATGITAVVAILTSIMKSSQVFQTLGGTVFKILGMMADLFLMPFVPLMMKFASWMISHMPEIQAWGEKAAGWAETGVGIMQTIWNVLSWIYNGTKDLIKGILDLPRKIADAILGKEVVDAHIGLDERIRSGTTPGEQKKREGMTQEQIRNRNVEQRRTGYNPVLESIAKKREVPYTPGMTIRDINELSGFGMGNPNETQRKIAEFFGRSLGLEHWGLMDNKQMGGVVPGGPGAKVPTMLHGGEIVVPQDIAAGGNEFSGKIAAWIERFQQKEMGPGGVMGKWYDEMFGNSILPDIWGNISGLFGDLEAESSTLSTKVSSQARNFDVSWISNLTFAEDIGAIGSQVRACFEQINEMSERAKDSMDENQDIIDAMKEPIRGPLGPSPGHPSKAQPPPPAAFGGYKNILLQALKDVAVGPEESADRQLELAGMRFGDRMTDALSQQRAAVVGARVSKDEYSRRGYGNVEGMRSRGKSEAYIDYWHDKWKVSQEQFAAAQLDFKGAKASFNLQYSMLRRGVEGLFNPSQRTGMTGAGPGSNVSVIIQAGNKSLQAILDELNLSNAMSDQSMHNTVI